MLQELTLNLILQKTWSSTIIIITCFWRRRQDEPTSIQRIRVFLNKKCCCTHNHFASYIIVNPMHSSVRKVYFRKYANRVGGWDLELENSGYSEARAITLCLFYSYELLLGALYRLCERIVIHKIIRTRVLHSY